MHTPRAKSALASGLDSLSLITGRIFTVLSHAYYFEISFFDVRGSLCNLRLLQLRVSVSPCEFIRTICCGGGGGCVLVIV